MTVQELIRDARATLIEAHRLADDLPRQQQAAISVFISGLGSLARALAETGRVVASPPAPGETSRRLPSQPPLALGME